MSKNVKERKMLLMLPLLVIPFLTMAFWALGGGRKKDEPNMNVGLNLKLPDANLKEDKLLDKLSFYDKANKDSLKMDEWMRSDPYFKRDSASTGFFADELQELTSATATKFNQRLNVSPYEITGEDPEEKIMRKIKLLETQMENKGNEVPVRQTVNSNNDFSSEVDRLEEMLKVNNSGSAEDPEIKHLEGTLDRILDIQHPQRVKERLKEKSKGNNDKVFAVSKQQGPDTITKGFYGVSDEKEVAEQNAIEAVVHENQGLVNGAVVKFRLTSDVFINGQLIPKDNFIFGIATLDGERLNVEISSIKVARNLYPVKLEVYDMDGLPGIYIPGAINRDVARQSADNSLSIMDMPSTDPSLKAQVARTGIGSIKNLLSKKVKLVKVTVKAGYKVFFKNKT